MANMYWVYGTDKMVSGKELKREYEEITKEFSIGFMYRMPVAVYKMMPKAKRPQFDYEATYCPDEGIVRA